MFSLGSPLLRIDQEVYIGTLGGLGVGGGTQVVGSRLAIRLRHPGGAGMFFFVCGASLPRCWMESRSLRGAAALSIRTSRERETCSRCHRFLRRASSPPSTPPGL